MLRAVARLRWRQSFETVQQVNLAADCSKLSLSKKHRDRTAAPPDAALNEGAWNVALHDIDHLLDREPNGNLRNHRRRKRVMKNTPETLFRHYEALLLPHGGFTWFDPRQ